MPDETPLPMKPVNVAVFVYVTRLRESERERGAAAYEAKRSAERVASVETWRQKETLRADT